MNVYQIEDNRDGQFHILTRSKDNPVVTPQTHADPLYVAHGSITNTMDFIRKVYKVMSYYYEIWGDEEPWPGNVVHPWAAKYCPLGELCCQRG